MFQPVRRGIMFWVLLLLSYHDHVFCSSIDYVSDTGWFGNSAQEANGTSKKIKRFAIDNGEEVGSGLYTDDYTDAEIDNEEGAYEEIFDSDSNLKPLKTTTASNVTSRPFSLPALKPKSAPTLTSNFTKQPWPNAEDCCEPLRLGSFDEFERCLGDRCLAPNTCEGPEIFERCLFEGRYYPVNTTVHMDETKCYLLKCTKRSTREPPSTEIEDFGTNCCTRAGQMYLSGTQLRSETCQEGNWIEEPSTPSTLGTSPVSTVSEEAESMSITSIQSTTPQQVETSSWPSTEMLSEGPVETTAGGTVSTSPSESTVVSGVEETTAATMQPTSEITEQPVETSPPPLTSGTSTERTESTEKTTGSETTRIQESTVTQVITGTAAAVVTETTEGLHTTSPAGEESSATPSTVETGVPRTSAVTGEVTQSTSSETVAVTQFRPSTEMLSEGPVETTAGGTVSTSPSESTVESGVEETTAATTQPTSEITEQPVETSPPPLTSETFTERTESTEKTTGSETTRIQESTVTQVITGTAATVVTETTEGLYTTSPAGGESSATPSTVETGAPRTSAVTGEVTRSTSSEIVAETQFTPGTSEASTTAEGSTESLEATVASGMTEAPTSISTEVTEGKTSISAEPAAAGAAFNKSAGTQPTEETIIPEATTSTEGVTSPTSAIPTTLIETGTSVLVESTEVLTTVTTEEQMVTAGAETQSTGTSSFETSSTTGEESTTATIGTEKSSTEIGVTEETTAERRTSTETSTPSATSVSPMASTTEESTTPPPEYTCKWDNLTAMAGGTLLRDPTRCLHVECWETIYGPFIDVTIVHEARGCCELQDKQIVPPGYVSGKKKCVFGRWHSHYFDAPTNMTSSREMSFKNKTYHFFPRPTSIREALQICEKINGTLAVPDNREQELELGKLGAEAFGGQVTFYINQDEIQRHVMNGEDKDNPEKYIVYPHDSKKVMHVKVNKPGTAYWIESFVENKQSMSVPICEIGGKAESFPEYFYNLVRIGALTDQGMPKDAAYRAMQEGKDSKTLARMQEWRLPPVPRKFQAGHSNLGKELRRWGQVHKDLALAMKNKKTFKDPLPIYKANHFNVK